MHSSPPGSLQNAPRRDYDDSDSSPVDFETYFHVEALFWSPCAHEAFSRLRCAQYNKLKLIYYAYFGLALEKFTIGNVDFIVCMRLYVDSWAGVWGAVALFAAKFSD